ncbi:MAG: serine/threonine protein kinase [Myxococcaceae bacterium]|nr:serine/threonine protein kinase [Myxococcaceae bacterium]
MAEVYLAEQLSLQRKVALKVLKRDLGKHPEMAERFRREARILSTVDHPALVRIIDFESSPQATVLVLELAEGETLEQALAHGPLEPQRVISLLAQLAEGLGVIHHMGVVHRDIKPQNVVLKHTPQGEQARLLDFGIARLMELPDDNPHAKSLAAPADPLVSHPGQVVGTPAYVAPEQATAQPLDARTDVYAFGVLAFRVLSGEYPFPGPSSRDFLRQHVSMAPRALVEAAPALKAHPKLVELVMQCLEKKPDRRPPNGQALLARLTPMLPQSDAMVTAITNPSRRVLAPLLPTVAENPGPSGLSRTLQAWSEKAGVLGDKTRGLSAAVITSAGSLSAEWRRSIAVVALMCSLIPVAWSIWPPTPYERAAALLDAGKTPEALTYIEEQLKTETRFRPQLLALKAAGLHASARHDEEREVLRSGPYQALHGAHRLLLNALAEDFARAEGDSELKALIGLVPNRTLRAAFEPMAKGDLSSMQWGALRYLDVTGVNENIDRVELYAHSLASSHCPTRAAAATRLAQLGDMDAVQALRTLSETPKVDSPNGVINCGQDEAAEAIRQLKKADRQETSKR